MATAKKVPAKKAVKRKLTVPLLAGNQNAAGNPGGGRPAIELQPEHHEIARKLALLGMDDSQIATYFEVSLTTFEKWKRESFEFYEALKRGKLLADAEIADSLHKRAIGYEHPEDDIRVVNGQIAITPTVKHYPPDTAAASLWLRNRQQKMWKDKVEVDHSGSVGFDKAPVEELTGALNDLLAKLK